MKFKITPLILILVLSSCATSNKRNDVDSDSSLEYFIKVFYKVNSGSFQVFNTKDSMLTSNEEKRGIEAEIYTEFKINEFGKFIFEGKSKGYPIEIKEFALRHIDKLDLSDNKNSTGTAIIQFKIFREPSNREAFKRAKEFHESKKYYDVLSTLDEIRGKDRNNICVLHLIAQANVKLKKYKEGLSLYNSALALSPNNSHLLFSRAYIFQKLKMYKEGILDLERSIALDPNSWEPYYLMNKLYNNLEDYETAINYATKGLKYRDDDYFYYKRAWSYQNDDQYDLSLIDINKAIEIDPSNKSDKARILYNKGDFEDALSLVNEILEKDEDRYDLHTKAMILDEIDKFDESIHIYELVIDKYEAKSMTYNNIGWIYMKQGDFKKAIQTFNVSIGLGLESETLQNNLGFSYYLNQEYENSLEAFNAAMKLDEKGTSNYSKTGISRSLIQLGELDKALVLLKEISKSDIEYEDGYFEYKFGKVGNYYKTALEELRESAKNNNHKKALKQTQKLINKIKS